MTDSIDTGSARNSSRAADEIVSPTIEIASLGKQSRASFNDPETNREPELIPE